ncbi:MAG: ribonuclease E/G, partial [Rhodospirillales bacterium]|nr:ribonuclease E/G [Rhodospirillales bacterium]
PGFLPLSRLGADMPHLTEGAPIIVQVDRDAAEGKGPKVTARPTLSGLFLIYEPGGEGVHVSSRIKGPERSRLLNALKDIVGDDEAVVARTAAEDANPEALAAELESLRMQWRDIKAKAGNSAPPSLLLAPPTALERALRDHSGPNLRCIVAEDPATLAMAREACNRATPGLDGLLELHRGKGALFDTHDIEAQIDEALSPNVRLPSGGSLVIERTAALTVVDVNSGGQDESGKSRMILAANLEAAEELARQVRLRNLSGQIVVDFINMRDPKDRKRLLQTITKVFSDDGRTDLFGMTRLGLVEIRRKAARASLADTLLAPCPSCGIGRLLSPETAAFSLMRGLLRLGRNRSGGGAAFAITTAPAVAAALNGALAEHLKEAERRAGFSVTMTTDPTLPPDGFILG